MIGGIINNILQHLQGLPNAKEVRKLLFLKLEMEFGSQRGIIDGQFEPYVAVETEVRNYGDHIPKEEPPVVTETPVEEIKAPEEESKEEESSNADV